MNRQKIGRALAVITLLLMGLLLLANMGSLVGRNMSMAAGDLVNMAFSSDNSSCDWDVWRGSPFLPFYDCGTAEFWNMYTQDAVMTDISYTSRPPHFLRCKIDRNQDDADVRFECGVRGGTSPNYYYRWCSFGSTGEQCDIFFTYELPHTKMILRAIDANWMLQKIGRLDKAQLYELRGTLPP